MIHTRRFGAAGGTPTLLAHCYLGSSGTWRDLVEAMAPVPDALAFDLPGHGRSPMPATLGDFHATVTDIIDTLVPAPMLLIGHSFGGASLLRFALRNPARVRALVLFEPVFIAAALADPRFDARAHDATYAQAAREGRLAEAARGFFTFNDPTRDWDALPEAARAQMTEQMRILPATEPGVVEDSGRLLEPGLMEGFDKPVLLLGGDRSPALFPAIIRALSDRLPRVEAHRIEGAGHMAPLTHAATCAAIINDWRQRHGV